MREPLRQQWGEHAEVISNTRIEGAGIALPLLLCSIGITALLACFDAPESAQGPHGRQSREAHRALAPVGAVITVKGNTRNRYGRTVAQILRGNTTVNIELVYGRKPLSIAIT